MVHRLLTKGLKHLVHASCTVPNEQTAPWAIDVKKRSRINKKKRLKTLNKKMLALICSMLMPNAVGAV